jgi:RNA polymerase sigma-70 factor (ECF subfamily)
MTESNSRISLIGQLLPLAVAGDAAAFDALLRHCAERFTMLTRRMMADYRRVRRWVETDDVLQNALVRLVNALAAVKPQTSRDFLALASLQIRRELIDLARHFYGPHGLGANYDSQGMGGHDSQGAGPHEPADVRDEPANLAQWTELHSLIDALPDDEREVMGLLFYQGLTQDEAAQVLGLSKRTLQRRWHDALAKLHRTWNVE